MTDSTPRATNLTPAELDDLRERARREAGPFANPAIAATTRAHNPEWARAVLGGPRSGAWWELYLIHLALQAEPSPPPPPLETAARAARERQEEAARRAAAEERAREEAAWRELVAVLRQADVRIEVRHNYTSHRHYEHYTQGADHVYLLDPLHVGRLHRDAGVALCHTPSNAHNLQVLDPMGDGRLPTCRACLRHLVSSARRLAPDLRGHEGTRFGDTLGHATP